MAPKSRRSKAKFRRLVQQPATSSTATATPTTTTATRPTTTTAAVQYDYIINDLKLIGAIAGSMILLIIILSFVL